MRQLAANRLSEWCNAPCLRRICRVGPYPLAGSQNALMFLEDSGAPEGPRVVNAASMADGIVHDDKRIGQGDELESRQIAIG